MSDENKKRTAKIELPEITRVDGHEAVYVDIEGDEVTSVRLDVFEGARFFEKLVTGKSYREMPHITSRVCAICSTGHVIAAIRAIEKIAGFSPDRYCRLFRELMHLGMIIESNATHLFALALPDFLGFEDVYQFATEHTAEFKMWTGMRNTGATIQTTIGGRPFHPVNLHAGGFSSYPNKEALSQIETLLKERLDDAIKLFEMFAAFKPPVARTSEPVFLALIPEEDHYGYFGDRVRASNGFEAAIEEYNNYLFEESVDYSHAKHSTFEGKPIMVGSLARLRLYSERLGKRARDLYCTTPIFQGDSNSIYNNLGQAIEIVEAIERGIAVVRELLESSPEWLGKKPRQEIPGSFEELSDKAELRRGVGSVECPRGTLYHDFSVDSAGMVVEANMITPSAQNTARIELDIREVVGTLLKRGGLEEEIERNLHTDLETLVRAYDPCNTCATHTVSVRYRPSSRIDH
ncbi:MAG TPA: Ni/Fe hydrogenase subunit alpha [Candidatus Melainabacteria bacterium]|nr:Ni/Fe hydrogenase subunit alpha [Candidatus Melainabacteria bacterium]